MLAQQAKVCFLAMVKANLVPSFRVVAAIALFAITPLVDILDFMAADAGFRRVLEFLVDMAGGVERVLVCAF